MELEEKYPVSRNSEDEYVAHGQGKPAVKLIVMIEWKADCNCDEANLLLYPLLF